MNFIVCALIAILGISILYLLIKLYLIINSLKEIEISLEQILKEDTNNLITISTSDKDIRKIAQILNKNLQDLRKQRLQYENGNQELKRTITNISHDIRTPLTGIIGYMDLIKEETDEHKKQKYLEIIERKANDLTLLTEQLFNYSKTMDTPTHIKKETYCINEIIEETLVSFYSIFKANNIVPEIDICKEKIYKNIDKNTMTRVFENILSNVSKYSDGNFKVKLEDDGKITFSNKAESLDATTVQKIFDRYFTVENAKKSTGIGLSIAIQLIELNGGKILAKYQNGDLIIEIEM